jgi:hypothetical protein
MKNENENVEMVESEDVANQEQPVIIQPTITPPRVLLEILVGGSFIKGSNPKDSKTFKKALELQDQIDRLRGKNKFMVRILWKTYEGDYNIESETENNEWLIENSSCKYYVFAPELLFVQANYIKDLLKAIQNFEKGLLELKNKQINFKKK